MHSMPMFLFDSPYTLSKWDEQQLAAFPSVHLHQAFLSMLPIQWENININKIKQTKKTKPFLPDYSVIKYDYHVATTSQWLDEVVSMWKKSTVPFVNNSQK